MSPLLAYLVSGFKSPVVLTRGARFDDSLRLVVSTLVAGFVEGSRGFVRISVGISSNASSIAPSERQNRTVSSAYVCWQDGHRFMRVIELNQSKLQGEITNGF